MIELMSFIKRYAEPSHGRLISPPFVSIYSYFTKNLKVWLCGQGRPDYQEPSFLFFTKQFSHMSIPDTVQCPLSYMFSLFTFSGVKFIIKLRYQ